MKEEVMQAEAIEEMGPADDEDVIRAEPVRHLPAERNGGQVDAWRGEVRTAALAAAGGLVAGVAAVTAVRAARDGGKRRKPARRPAKRQDRPANVVASRSFLVDVHLLGR